MVVGMGAILVVEKALVDGDDGVELDTDRDNEGEGR
jgi:hypothetical protein